jgi:hypothetical protein
MGLFCAVFYRSDEQYGLPRIISVLARELLNHETCLCHQVYPRLQREETSYVPVLLYA